MPKVIISADDIEHGYEGFTHLEALMHFPEDGKDRDAVRDALRRRCIMSRIDFEDTFPVSLSRAEYKTLINARDYDSVVQEYQITKRARKGLLASWCLRYFLSVETHHKCKHDSSPINTIECWETYLLDHLYKENRNSARNILGSSPPKTDPTLREVRQDFLPVAHYWAAAYNMDGTPTGLFNSDTLIEFIEVSEAYRREAVRLGIYGLAVKGGSSDMAYEVARTISVPPDEHDAGGEELVLDYDTERPITVSPLPSNVVAMLKKRKKE